MPKMKHILRFVATMAAVGMIVAWVPKAGLAAENVSYSGKYSAQHVKGTPSGSPDSVLEVVQSENDIEITRVESGKRTTSRCPFNGPEGDYTSPGGVAGKCKAQLKGKNLIVESVVLTHPQPTATVRMHTKERWQLSSDSKTLTIKSDVDFPDSPAGVSAAIAGDTSSTTKYTRTENP
jgi:hypothetical protein